ncbi:TIGR02206 family membrane protein [Paenibacillus thermotolerans]|uniref:YwaF family protein n=1 Tax=Paenibacillus thermotolerans TaxID=3027807 RepID=UPI002367589F|nr:MULTISPECIES: TIGR02206 family membrane protein [unclassified Paenibacillus]
MNVLEEGFVFLSAPHLAGLAATVATIAAIVVFRARLRYPAFRYGLAALLAATEVALYTWYTVTDQWGWFALPFQLCTVTLWLSVAVLLTRNRKLYEVTFFLGILGALQALLTPYLEETYPSFRYFHFFTAHIAIIAASVYMTAVEGFRPTGRSVLRALLWLNVLAIPASIANVLTGYNFMFLARKPATGSLLDVLAPWPWYILQLEAVALAMCFLLLVMVKGIDLLFRRFASVKATEKGR